jgi:glutamate 5-kinase
MQQLASQIAEQRKAGKEMVIVSSGAVGAGMGVLGYDKRPSTWPNCRPAPQWASPG